MTVAQKTRRYDRAVRVVLLDLPSYTPPYDHELASALARRGHDVTLLTSPFPFGEAPRPAGYRRDELFFPASGRMRRLAPRSRLRFAVKAIEYLPSVARLRRRLAQLSPDVVHVQWLALPRRDLTWLRRLAAERPTVFTAHDLLGRRGERSAELWREVFDTVQRVVVHSRRAVAELSAAGVDGERIARIAHASFGGSTAGPAGSAPNGRSLLFFGLLRDYKGLDVLVRALPDIPETRLVVAGDTLDSVEGVRELAARLGVADRIEWRLGFVPDDEVPGLMARASAVVLPYRRADSSGVLATALGHGRPAVVSDVGSLGETVSEFAAGRVVPPGDAHALAVACRSLLEDPGALVDAARGAVRAGAALTWDAAGEAHERLYLELLGR